MMLRAFLPTPISSARSGGLLLLIGLVLMLAPRPADAVPSFARQTGLGCGACHTAFPQLTPFGRRFKLNGYTLLGPDTKPLGQPGWVPPVSAMTIFGFTHTATPMDNAGTPLQPNNNVELQQASVFFAGALTEHLGVFAQGTYAGPQFGTPSQVTWDNLDVRYAGTTHVNGMPVVYGITVNNSPTVQDVWNTTPAWGYPFVASNLSNTPGAHTLIDNGFAAHVLGATGYVFINDMLLIEGGGYETLPANTQSALGVMAAGGPASSGVIPYFRVAFEPHWGDHYLEVGAFGLSANVTPANAIPGTGLNQYRDVGFDSQYQYLAGGYGITVRATYLHEDQILTSSFANGFSANPTDTLNTFRAQAELMLGDGPKVLLTAGYFNTWGSSDSMLYACNRTFSPNSDGYVAEIAYVPFGKTIPAPAVWPWVNAKIGLQYIWYDKFNGASVNFDNMGTNARDENTLYAYVWVAF
jgi:hypothetical protein